MATLHAALIQLAAGPDKKSNLAKALRQIERASRTGARVVALPENFLFRGSDKEFKKIPEALTGPSLKALRAMAAARRIYLLAGSFAEAVSDSQKTYNTSCLIDPHGRIQSVYRKMHLFDVDLPGKRIRESDRCLRGKKPVVGRIQASGRTIRCGLSICYDLRFPELYRGYALRGAQVLFVPSNFTRHTGQDHWEPLLRTRAIENQCFVLAPAQAGVGSQGILSHGNSMILDPWGRILAKAPGGGEAVVAAKLDLAQLAQIRLGLPSLQEASRLNG